MTEPAPRSSRPAGGRAHGRVLLAVTLVLAVLTAAALALGSDDVRWLRLGILSALWAGLTGAIVVGRRARPAAATDVEDIRTVYRLELEREVAARREHELTVERDVHRRVAEETRSDLDALREELRSLRRNLEALVGGEVLVERVALRADARRMRAVPEGRATADAAALPAAGLAAPRPRQPRGEQRILARAMSGDVLPGPGWTAAAEPAAAAATPPADPVAPSRRRLSREAASRTSTPDPTPPRGWSPDVAASSPPAPPVPAVSPATPVTPASPVEPPAPPAAPAAASVGGAYDPLFGELPSGGLGGWDGFTSWEPPPVSNRPTTAVGRHRGNGATAGVPGGNGTAAGLPGHNGAAADHPGDGNGTGTGLGSGVTGAIGKAGGGRRRAPEPEEQPAGSHNAGRSVQDLLAAYGADSSRPRRHHTG